MAAVPTATKKMPPIDEGKWDAFVIPITRL